MDSSSASDLDHFFDFGIASSACTPDDSLSLETPQSHAGADEVIGQQLGLDA